MDIVTFTIYSTIKFHRRQVVNSKILTLGISRILNDTKQINAVEGNIYCSLEEPYSIL
jgi:hypothetical protein